MNFQRGAKRIFSVIAVCWAAPWLILAIINVPENHQDQAHQLMEYAVTIVVPIALLYALLFLVIPWIARLAVVIRYEQYLKMQNQLEDALRAVQAYQSEALHDGLRDAASGKIKRMGEVDPSL